jgi:N-acetylneuraminic acid mutarotase
MSARSSKAGNKFYMFGGREMSQQLDTYDYTNNKWTTGASAPQSFYHFQAVKYEGLIWVIGAFKDNKFLVEKPAEFIYVYDPAKDVWMSGLQLPKGRQRGGGGLAVYQGKFYLVGGNTNGHAAGFVPWLDAFNQRTATWMSLADAPHSHDHFHAAIVGDQMYAVGGRRTTRGNTFGNTVVEVDVYDFKSDKWLKTGLPNNLPLPLLHRA